VLRFLAPLTIAGLLLSGCGPDHRRCAVPHPDFVVLLKLSDRPLPPDTVVKVTYAGSGTESYELASPNKCPEVVFCTPATSDCSQLDQVSGAACTTGATGAIGAAGASSEDAPPTEALSCELWTGGFATLKVEGTGLNNPSFDLTPDGNVCTVSRCIVLDSPDGG
jgi:hypothetical protein